jgi:hypothetical protein
MAKVGRKSTYLPFLPTYLTSAAQLLPDLPARAMFWYLPAGKMKKVCSGGKVKFCCGSASTGPSRQSDVLVPSGRENEKSDPQREVHRFLPRLVLEYDGTKPRQKNVGPLADPHFFIFPAGR